MTMMTPDPSVAPAVTAQEASERKAFIFYSNWYEDTLQSLSEEQQGAFLLIIVRYASKGTLPGPDVDPMLRTMFGLIRNVLDSDLKKYEKLVEANRKRAEMNHQRCVENQRIDHKKPILNTQNTELNTQNSTSNEEKKEEEEALSRVVDFSEIEAYWKERSFKSDARDFYGHYEACGWTTRRGCIVQSWKKAACMWEDKFRRDVLPARRREEAAVAAAEMAERRSREAAERQRIRSEEHEACMAEADRRAATAVTREQGRQMYQTALALTQGDEDRALELLRRASDEPDLFRRLLAAGA